MVEIERDSQCRGYWIELDEVKKSQGFPMGHDDAVLYYSKDGSFGLKDCGPHVELFLSDNLLKLLRTIGDGRIKK
jgi:hypothetical protein